MLKVSNKGRYAVRALFDLAFHASDQPAQLRDIAARQRIPLRFLEQIFQDLKRARLVDSKRGPRGGYQLARSPDRICVGDVLRALDGPIALIADAGEGNGASVATRAARASRASGSANGDAAGTKTSRAKAGLYAQRARASEADLRAVTDGVFTDLARDVERCFDAVTLEHLCVRGESLGLRRRARFLPNDYVI